jgi:16S rRNA pseudouridine516 synthase
MQLERILHKLGFGTRKECRALCLDGRVAVNGEPCDEPFGDFACAGLVLGVDGVEWPYAEFATVMLNKPAGYECSRKPLHHPGVLSLLPPPLRQRGVQPIGRLDEDTTGLLLITDDGQLNHQLSGPSARCRRSIWRRPSMRSIRSRSTSLLAGVVLNDDPGRSPLSPARSSARGACA